MLKLSGSVGQGGTNTTEDVRLVQQLLNRLSNARSLGPALVEDGVAGEKTTARIISFQRTGAGMNQPDGRIDPDGRTWRALLALQPIAAAAPAETVVNRPAGVNAFLADTLPAARKVRETWGVPVSVCLAQAALESGWGKAVKGNAYFGIKGKSSEGRSINFGTSEYIDGRKVSLADSFRASRDFAESADDYGRFLRSNPRYQACFDYMNDPSRFAEQLQASGYATDPSYAEKIKSIIRKNRLDLFDEHRGLARA